MNPSRLFVASCISLVTSAFTFVVRGDLMPAMKESFGLSQEQIGGVEFCVFLGMAVSMLIGGFICDALGMKNIMWLAFGCHLVGTLGTIYAPHQDVKADILWLSIAAFITGCGNGMVETAVNPLVATMFPTRKTHFLNILHAWWPGGLVIGGVLAAFLGAGISFGSGNAVPGLNFTIPQLGFNHWQSTLLLILLPTLVYGVMVAFERFPATERVAAGVSSGDMFGQVFRPGFLLLALCMIMTASTELGPNKWLNSVMTRTAGVSGTMVLVYTSGLMFVMRHFAGQLAHAISPVGMLLMSSVLSGVGLYLMSTATNGVTAFGYATIFGVGVAYFWPTMIGVTAERFPKGGAFLMCLIGSVGNLGVSESGTQMGAIYDYYASQTVRAEDPELAKTVIQTGEVNSRASLFKQVVLKEPSAEAAKGESISEAQAAKVPADSPSKQILDKAEAVGAAMAFRWMSVLPVALVVLFGLMYLYDLSRGGYKAEHITADRVLGSPVTVE